jgi:hypothetical protein
MIGGADEPDEEKRKAFGSKQQQQRATGTNDTLMAFGMLFSLPSSYNPSIQFEQSIATEAVKAIDGREFSASAVAKNMLKSLAGPFGSFRFNAVADSTDPMRDVMLASAATMIGANPFTEAAITAIAKRDVFGKDLTENRYARVGDVRLNNEATTNERIAAGLSELLGSTVSASSVKSLLSNFPYLKGPLAATGLNRFVKDDTSEFTARAAWQKQEAELAPLVERANTLRQKEQNAAGIKPTNFSFSEKSRPTAEELTALGLSATDAAKLVVYYEVTGATKAATLNKEGRARLATKLGRAENDTIYAAGLNILREIEKQ